MKMFINLHEHSIRTQSCSGNLYLKPMLHNQGLHKEAETLRKESCAELETAAGTPNSSSTAEWPLPTLSFKYIRCYPPVDSRICCALASFKQETLSFPLPAFAALQLEINIFTHIPLITLLTKASKDNISFISNFIPLSSTCPHLPRPESSHSSISHSI